MAAVGLRPHNLIDLLLCANCRTTFNSVDHQPINIGCGHVLCKSCLQQIEELKCPVDLVDLPSSVHTFPVNSALLTLVDQSYQVPHHASSLTGSFDEILQQIAVLFKHTVEGENNLRHISQALQNKLFDILSGQTATDDGKHKALKSSESLVVLCVTQLIVRHQVLQQVVFALWAAVRTRGCQFLGPGMQEKVLKCLLQALKGGDLLSRKVLVVYVVDNLQNSSTSVSKTAVGHVIQLLYRASCFKVTKRDDDSSLMQLRDEFRSYESLRCEHDSQIVTIALEAGLRISPEQWSALLYGDCDHTTYMQLIVEKTQGPVSLDVLARELKLVLDKTGDPAKLIKIDEHIQKIFTIVQNVANAPDEDQQIVSAEDLITVLKSSYSIAVIFIDFMKEYGARKLDTFPPTKRNYKTVMCRDLQLGVCPRGTSCNFAHSPEDIERYSAKNRKAYTRSRGISPTTDMEPCNLHCPEPTAPIPKTIPNYRPVQLPVTSPSRLRFPGSDSKPVCVVERLYRHNISITTTDDTHTSPAISHDSLTVTNSSISVMTTSQQARTNLMSLADDVVYTSGSYIPPVLTSPTGYQSDRLPVSPAYTRNSVIATAGNPPRLLPRHAVVPNIRLPSPNNYLLPQTYTIVPAPQNSMITTQSSSNTGVIASAVGNIPVTPTPLSAQPSSNNQSNFPLMQGLMHAPYSMLPITEQTHHQIRPPFTCPIPGGRIPFGTSSKPISAALPHLVNSAQSYLPPPALITNPDPISTVSEHSGCVVDYMPKIIAPDPPRIIHPSLYPQLPLVPQIIPFPEVPIHPMYSSGFMPESAPLPQDATVNTTVASSLGGTIIEQVDEHAVVEYESLDGDENYEKPECDHIHYQNMSDCKEQSSTEDNTNAGETHFCNPQISFLSDVTVQPEIDLSAENLTIDCSQTVVYGPSPAPYLLPAQPYPSHLPIVCMACPTDLTTPIIHPSVVPVMGSDLCTPPVTLLPEGVVRPKMFHSVPPLQPIPTLPPVAPLPNNIEVLSAEPLPCVDPSLMHPNIPAIIPTPSSVPPSIDGHLSNVTLPTLLPSQYIFSTGLNHPGAVTNAPYPPTPSYIPIYPYDNPKAAEYYSMYGNIVPTIIPYGPIPPYPLPLYSFCQAFIEESGSYRMARFAVPPNFTVSGCIDESAHRQDDDDHSLLSDNNLITTDDNIQFYDQYPNLNAGGAFREVLQQERPPTQEEVSASTSGVPQSVTTISSSTSSVTSPS